MENENKNNEDILLGLIVIIRWIFEKLDNLCNFISEKSFALFFMEETIVYTVIAFFIFCTIDNSINNSLTHISVLLPFFLYLGLLPLGFVTLILGISFSHLYDMMSCLHAKMYPDNFFKNRYKWKGCIYLRDKIDQMQKNYNKKYHKEHIEDC